MKLIECVPNFSEGRDNEKIEYIADAFRNKNGVKLLDHSADPDHNRMVITAAGEPQPLKEAVVKAIGRAVEVIDLREHQGVHPRIGAADVVPFIPLEDAEMADAVALSKEVAAEVSAAYSLPIFLYEESAQKEERKNLAYIRQGGFAALGERMAKDPAWKADFGPEHIHPSAGATAMGARKFLIAYNVNLKSNDLALAKAIAAKIRTAGGGLPSCKALGLELKEQGIVQVSMNLTDFNQTAIWQAYEAVKEEAAKAGVEVLASELIGLTPLEAVLECTRHYLRFENLDLSKILDLKLK